jgi:hypothetical protein
LEVLKNLPEGEQRDAIANMILTDGYTSVVHFGRPLDMNLEEQLELEDFNIQEVEALP